MSSSPVPTDIAMPHITLLLGGVRSGKSARAVALANANDNEHRTAHRVLFVATGQAFDDEMVDRITRHRLERPEHWTTLESPRHLAADLKAALHSASPAYDTVLIDCVTIWVSNILLAANDQENVEHIVTHEVSALIHLLTATPVATSLRHVILVSNEVGLGVVPPTSLGRQYRDALGRANQLLASGAHTVSLMVAGLTLPLKGTAPR